MHVVKGRGEDSTMIRQNASPADFASGVALSPAADGLSCNADRLPADGVPERSDRAELVRRWQKNESSKKCESKK